MNLSEFTYLLNHPDAVTAAATEELDKIVTEFPYFQSARALRLKGLYKEDSFRYNYALKVTAAYTADRGVLFDFITSNHFQSVSRTVFENRQHQVLELDVTDEAQTEELLSEEPFVETIAEEVTPEVVFHDNSEPEVVLENATESESEPIPEPALVDPATKSILDSIREATVHYTVVEPDQPDLWEPKPEEANPEITVAPQETAASAAQENLNIGKPLEFSQGERHSFQEWLQLSTFRPVERVEETMLPVTTDSIPGSEEDQEDDDRQKKNELIDRFIASNPKISPVKKENPLPSLQVEPSRAVDNSYLMTETLARVYLEQKKYDKAIQAYEILILKYPEKSSFFADRILDIKTLKNNNN